MERAAGEHATELERLADTGDQLHAEAGVVDTLHAVGRQLTAQLDIDRLVRTGSEDSRLRAGVPSTTATVSG